MAPVCYRKDEHLPGGYAIPQLDNSLDMNRDYHVGGLTAAALQSHCLQARRDGWDGTQVDAVRCESLATRTPCQCCEQHSHHCSQPVLKPRSLHLHPPLVPPARSPNPLVLPPLHPILLSDISHEWTLCLPGHTPWLISM